METERKLQEWAEGAVGSSECSRKGLADPTRSSEGELFHSGAGGHSFTALTGLLLDAALPMGIKWLMGLGRQVSAAEGSFRRQLEAEGWQLAALAAAGVISPSSLEARQGLPCAVPSIF